MALMIIVTSSAMATSITDNEYDDSAMDFRNSHGKVYATSRTEQLAKDIEDGWDCGPVELPYMSIRSCIDLLWQ